MNEIGEILRQARIEKGYTLDDLQQITKIQKRYLEAIEKGNADILPGRFYARAFVKQYADIVDLDGEELLNEHLEVSSQEVNEELAESISSSPTRAKVEKNNILTTLQEQLPTILIFVLVAAILVVIYFAFRRTGIDEDAASQMISDEQNEELIDTEIEQENEETESEDDSASETKEETESEDEDEDDEEELKQGFNITESTRETTTYEVGGPHPEEQTITLTAEDGESWVSIQVDGNVVGSQTLSVGSSLSADFDDTVKEVTLRIGNAGATQITLNDDELSYGEESQGTVQNMIINFTE